MSESRIKWPVLVVALLCLLPVAGGVALLRSEGGQSLGWALVGFFGSGVVVLGRKAFQP
ncbi:MAG: Alpha/beta hydrolase fold protein [Nocardioides sp.]|jgi:hypothetical protein|nr:Alpha/beta hydrolase fold protein [Nocardioides sp.]